MQTILVIDDDESLRDTIGVLLEREGFRPVLVGDGKSGLQQSLTLKPDLVLVEPRGVNAFFVRDDLAHGLPAAAVDGITIAPEAVGDFGPGGIYSFLDRAGLALVDV